MLRRQPATKSARTAWSGRAHEHRELTPILTPQDTPTTSPKWTANAGTPMTPEQGERCRRARLAAMQKVAPRARILAGPHRGRRYRDVRVALARRRAPAVASAARAVTPSQAPRRAAPSSGRPRSRRTGRASATRAGPSDDDEPSADQLRALLARHNQRCPVCGAPLRALGRPARYVGCGHCAGLTDLAGKAIREDGRR